jgi:hypothetical protein
MNFHGEIQYTRLDENGEVFAFVHSDICWDCGGRQGDKPLTEEYREFLHRCLDEWLDKSNGTGAFRLGSAEYFPEDEND